MLDLPGSWFGVVLALTTYAAVPSTSPQWPEAKASVSHEALRAGMGVARDVTAQDATHVASANATSKPHATDKSGDGTLAKQSDTVKIEGQTVCVGSRTWSAGELGSTLLYRVRRIDGKLHVGYFAHWTTERPWGPNALSYTLLPALVTDGVYSHFLYVFPGAKDVLYGPDDVEGVGVEFEAHEDGSLSVLEGRAESGTHGPVRLTREDLVDSKGRIVLLTDVWSHQLGAHGGGRFADLGTRPMRCYDHRSLRPMSDAVARAFRLGDERQPLRAKPAWGPSMLSTEKPSMATASR